MTTPADRPDSSALADAAGAWRSAYLHIPFCTRICPYCDFAVVEGRDDSMDRYVAAVERELSEEPVWGEFDAVFVGGGTPSSIPPDRLNRLLGVLSDRFGLVSGAEVTLEANPEDWTDDKAAALVEGGFTRVSFGAQSLDTRVLDSLGRRHAPGDVETAVVSARRAGIGSVSLDLIFGTPGESLDSWRETVRRAIDLEVDHVSAYSLTVEPATALGRAVRGGAPAPDADDQADKWELAAEMLAGAGFVRYEVSNYARPGHHCLYNLAVWDQGEYLGAGLGAHGFRDGVRKRNLRRLDTYMERVESGIGAVQAAERVEGWAAEQERLMLGMRRTAGVVMGAGGEVLIASDDGIRLREAGVIAEVEDRLVVARPLLTDEVTRSVLALPAR